MTFLLTLMVVCTSAISLPMFAKENNTSSLKVTVIGNGEVKVECNDFDYTVTENDGFIHDVKTNTDFTFTVTEKSQPLKRVTINQIEKGSDKVMKYTVKGNADIVFEFEDNLNTTVEKNEESSSQQSSEKELDKETKETNDLYDQPSSEKATDVENDNRGKLKIDKDNVNDKFVLSDEEQKIREDYARGDKQSHLEERKAIVEKINAFDYVDENYFITGSYFNDYNTLNTLVYLKASILVDTDYSFSEETQIMPMSLSNPVITSFYNSSIVTFADSIGNSVVMDGGYWKVDGHVAFCSNARQSPPKNGAKLKASVASNNTNLRKALYYGYSGPDDRLSSSLSKDKAIVVTNELASNAKSGTSFCTMHGAGYVIKDKYSWIYDLPTPPSNFKVYTADGIEYGSNSLGETQINQTMAYWILEEKGGLQIKKESANPELTNGNN